MADFHSGQPLEITYDYSYIYSTDGAAPTMSGGDYIRSDGTNGGYRHDLRWSEGTKWGTLGTSHSLARVDEGEIPAGSIELQFSVVCTYKIGKRSEFSHIVSTRNVVVGGPIDDEIQRKDLEERKRWQR